MAKKRKKLSEDAAIQIVLKDHPQWRRQWDNGSLPDEVVGDDGEPISPRVHIMVHCIVERQLAADEPKGVAAIAGQLEQLGLSRHDIRHEIGRAMTNQLWYMGKEGCAFDEKRYLAELRESIQSGKRKGHDKGT